MVILPGFLTTVSMVPEVIETFKTRDVKDLSYAWLISAGVGFVAWTAYGYMLNSIPLIVFSAATLVLYSIMLAMKAKYSGKARRPGKKSSGYFSCPLLSSCSKRSDTRLGCRFSSFAMFPTTKLNTFRFFS